MPRIVFVLTLAVSTFPGLAVLVQAQICEDYLNDTRRIGVFYAPEGDYTEHPVFVGEYLYVGSAWLGNTVFNTVDMTDAENPQFVASMALPNDVYRFIGGDNHVYALSDSVLIIDVTDPLSPYISGSVALAGHHNDAVLIDNLLYVSTGGSGLEVVDVADPIQPVVIGNLAELGISRGLAVSDGYAYVITTNTPGLSHLQIVDISDPSLPEIINTVETIDSYKAVAVENGIVYLGVMYDDLLLWDQSYLQVMDMTDPFQPSIIGRAELPFMLECCVSITKRDDFLYMTTYNEDYGLAIFDVDQPTDPEFLRSYSFDDPTYSLTIREDLMVLGLRYAMETFRIGNNRIPDPIASVEMEFTGTYEIRDHLLYYADYDYGLRIYDLHDFSNVHLVGEVETPDNGWVYKGAEIRLSGDHAYISDTAYGLNIVDVSDPSAPVHVANCLSGIHYLLGLALWGDYAYLVAGDDHLYIVDISNPESPVVESPFLMNCDANDIEIVDGLLYVNSCGLEIFSLLSPTQPALLGALSGYVGQIHFENGIVYMTRGQLHVIDATDPSDPYWLSTTDLETYDWPSWNAHNMALIWPYAYVPIWDRGVAIVDISNAVAPVLAGSIDHGSYAVEVMRYGENLCVGYHGFRILAPQCSGSFSAAIEMPIQTYTALLPNYPNPFNPSTSVSYTLSSSGAVKLTIYDVSGRRVRLLVNESQDTGTQSVEWNGRSDEGRISPAGIYFARLEACGRVETRKLALVK